MSGSPVESGRPPESLPGTHRSYWIDSTPATSYPALGGEVKVDVAVIGGGIVGITCALLLKEAGGTVALLEADRLAAGVTGHTTAQVTAQHDVIYARLISQFGREKARQYAQANQAAIEQIAALVDRHRIECDFSRLPFTLFAETDGTLREVEKELQAAQEAGLAASWVESIPFPIPCRGGMRVERQAQFHPRRYLLALAALIPGGGSHIFETTRVTGIREGEPCTVEAAAGSVKAREVIIATHYPILGMKALYAARLYSMHHYALGLSLPGRYPAEMLLSAEKDGMAWRATPTSEGELILVDDGAHKVGQGGDTRRVYRALVERVHRFLPEARVRYRWSTPDTETVDRVPYIGRLSSDSRHQYLATGFAAWGMTTGTAAGLILRDLILKGSCEWAPVFDPQRVDLLASAGRFLRQNANVARRFFTGRVGLPRKRAAEVPSGEAEVITSAGGKAGVVRDAAGQVTAVDPTCTHLGCIVAWNPAERTWDCPCHGSRFTADGRVIHAPAVKDLRRIEPGSI